MKSKPPKSRPALTVKKHRKYQKKLSLYPRTFAEVVDTVLHHRPKDSAVAKEKSETESLETVLKSRKGLLKATSDPVAKAKRKRLVEQMETTLKIQKKAVKRRQRRK